METIPTLLRLARNPHYKFTPAQLEALQEYRSQQIDQRAKEIKHDTTVQKHDTSLPEEQRKGRG